MTSARTKTISFRQRVKTTAIACAGAIFGKRCPACGHRALIRGGGEFPPTLAREWQISRQWAQWFVDRECYHCAYCRSERRTQFFAAEIVAHFNRKLGLSTLSLDELCRHPTMHSVRVAEINSAGNIHQFLARLPRIEHSEYKSLDPAVPHQDLINLTYADNTFDVALTSETLEHVPDVDRALSEIHRVLKPGATHLFTIPVIWDRPQTLERARLTADGLENVLPPSFHGDPVVNATDYLVFYEFGADIEPRIRAAGFDLEIVRHPTNRAMSVFISTKR